MKTPILILLLALAFHAPAHAADDLISVLQRGLFEEEADHDLASAIKAYQFVVAGADAQRKLAATAVFRLGECYRKLGQTNDAVAQYQRIVRDFVDQTNLVTLSQQNLTGLGANTERPRGKGMMGLTVNELLQLQAAHKQAGGKSGPTPAQIEAHRLLIERLELEIKTAEAKLARQKENIRQGLSGQGSTEETEARLLDLRRQLILAEEAGPGGTADSAASAATPSQNFSPAARTQLKELLQNEVKIAEQFAVEQRKRVETGTLAVGDQVRFERDVLGLKRQLIAADGLSSAEDRQQWRALLLEEIKLAEEAVKLERQKFDAGKSIASEVARLQRDVLILKRELVISDSAPAPAGASVTTPSAAPTDEEEKEIRRIQALIKDSPDLINASGPDWTPLHQAATRGQLVVARFLLENGANVDQKTSNNQGPALLLAAAQGHKGMVELLLAKGANPNVKKEYGSTALHEAAAKGFVAVVEVLLANKAELDARDNSGRTPLHRAVGTGQTPVVEALLRRGADVNARSDNGDTTLHLAATRDDARLIDLLLNNKADINARTKSGASALWTALDQNRVEAVRTLLKNGASTDLTVSGSSPIHRAVAQNSPELVQLLLEHKAEPDLPNSSGMTPLQTVVIDGRNPGLIPMLVKAGANPNTPLPENTYINVRDSRRGISSVRGASLNPLLIAAILRRDLPQVEALLANGADVNAADPAGDYHSTALMYAIYSGQQDLLDAVLRHKPDLELRTKRESRTALHQAVGNGDVKGTEALIKAGSKIDALDDKGWTPLFIAVAAGRSEDVRALLRSGANPNAQALDGTLPLFIARNWQPIPGGEGSRQELSKLLIQHGADESLLRRRTITVTRRGRNYEQVVFRKGTNDFNHHTLYEVMAGIYNAFRSEKEKTAFPDLRRIAIERIDGKSGTRQILVDLEARATSSSCTNDLRLEWGDLLEIRETEHPLNANWPGLAATLATNISQCLSRTVNLVIKGSTNRIELRANVAFESQVFGPDGRHLNGYQINQDSCRLTQVLRRSGLLLTTSDLARVRVRHRDSATGQTRQWIVSGENPDSATDLWLQNGDEVEVPEKDPNAPSDEPPQQPLRSIERRSIRSTPTAAPAESVPPPPKQ